MRIAARELADEIRALRIQWRRSDDDYRDHPLTICLGVVLTRSGSRPCMAARGKKDHLCRTCRKAAAAQKREQQ